ncbi:MAG: transmembrane prediction [Acidobacteria bacterium]|nr:MAG: transmembrane prediction [Acidobacteriota bacterium]
MRDEPPGISTSRGLCHRGAAVRRDGRGAAAARRVRWLRRRPRRLRLRHPHRDAQGLRRQLSVLPDHLPQLTRGRRRGLERRLAARRHQQHLLIRLTDEELFDCPFVMMTEPGGAAFDDEEAAKLRLYLEKGGFLWADDFWGEYAWSWWVSQLRKALPAAEFPIFDVPLDHPMFHTQFEVKKVPQIPSINFFFGGRGTSERGADSAVPHARGIADKKGRMIVLMTHNTDFGDSWEREGDDATYFVNFGPDGYAFGIDAVIYALTH